MADSVLEGRRAVMFVCGDDEAGNPSILKLTEEVGFEAINAGKLSSARLLEPTLLPPTVRTQLHFCHSKAKQR